MEFPVPLLTLLQLQGYLVRCISARVFIIPKLQNIYWRKFICELFSLSTEHLSKGYSVRRSDCFNNLDWTFREHISRSLPTERIFYLLRSVHSTRLLREYTVELMLNMLEIIIKWLQVSVSECNRQTPRTKIRFVSRDLVPNDRATCTIVSRVNFFDTRLSINFYMEV